jgi:hypothetical protein
MVKKEVQIVVPAVVLESNLSVGSGGLGLGLGFDYGSDSD